MPESHCPTCTCEPDTPLTPWRYIGYTVEECERVMRRMTNGERGCANPDEHNEFFGDTRDVHSEPAPMPEDS